MGVKMQMRRISMALAGLFFSIFILVQMVSAGEAIEVDHLASLMIQYPCEGADFDLYRVADVKEDVIFTLTEAFKDYSVEWKDKDAGSWKELAETLAAYTVRDGISPLKSGVTDQNGNLQFTDLKPGMFLIIGYRKEMDGFNYVPESFLICLPNPDDAGKWNYDVTVRPKYDKNTDGKVDRKVLKVWKDDGYQKRRPESIQVQLLKDNVVWDTVTLSEANNWRAIWSDLDGGSVWRVTEKSVPSGYSVKTEIQGITFVVTNTYRRSDSGGGDSSGGSDGGSSDSSGPPTTSGDSGQGAEEILPFEIMEGMVPLALLPQTGMLWWPVPLLAFCGMVFCMIGWMIIRKYENVDE